MFSKGGRVVLLLIRSLLVSLMLSSILVEALGVVEKSLMVDVPVATADRSCEGE